MSDLDLLTVVFIVLIAICLYCAGAIFFPIAVVHGIGLWFGLF